MLGTMFSGRHKIHKQKNGSVFIDRDGTHFRVILNYLRGEISSKSQLSDDRLALSELSTECDFYQLQELKNIVKSKEEQPKVVKRKNIDELLRLNSQRDYYNETTQDLVLRNLIFNNLIFSKILFDIQ